MLKNDTNFQTKQKKQQIFNVILFAFNSWKLFIVLFLFIHRSIECLWSEMNVFQKSIIAKMRPPKIKQIQKQQRNKRKCNQRRTKSSYIVDTFVIIVTSCWINQLTKQNYDWVVLFTVYFGFFCLFFAGFSIQILNSLTVTEFTQLHATSQVTTVRKKKNKNKQNWNSFLLSKRNIWTVELEMWTLWCHH